ncbi:MAG: NADH-quinone oxidoreductase subunit J [Polyangiaceae bacterium]|nr:NADH-quinone oxidoreductase subunit J [Polyangiaceae bacterium]
MNMLELAFFGLCALIALLGAIATVAAKNPIRGAMGLLSTIVGIAGLYLTLAAEFLATIQLLVYAGAVVILFLFVIMLLGPSAVSKREARGPWARYVGAGALLLSSLAMLALIVRAGPATPTAFAKAPAKFGTIESIGHELFTNALIPFELSGALLLVAVVGAVAVARGKQIDPTLLPAADPKGKEAQS